MKHKRYIQPGWVLLLTILVLGSVATPASADSRLTRHITHVRASGSTPINAVVYLTNGSLDPLFQSNIEAQAPAAFNSALNSMVSKLPPQDQSWAMMMADTLIQPSVTLISLKPQQGGLAATVQVHLYNGDPKPITASMLITFSVANSSTVQVTAKPLNGSPALVSGPVATFQIPFGQLNSISSTSTCGSAALAMKMLFPIALGQAQAGQTAALAQTQALNAPMQPQTIHRSDQLRQEQVVSSASANTNSYVEIPAPSLAQMGSSIGTMPFGSMTAQNIQISVQGQNLVITSDVYLNSSFQIGTAVTTMAPTASGGNLAVNVLSTNFNLFGLFTINENSYNQQIEQTINAKLNGALAGKFNITAAAIGPNSQLPCAASDSLLLTGTTNLS